MYDITVHPTFLRTCGYTVYEHVFPDGKRYIGISNNVKRRWRNNGKEYDGVKNMREAINKYGWDNIQHNIIAEYIPRGEAQKLEQYLIKALDTENNGYNQRGGGELPGNSLYSEHVTKRIRRLRSLPYPGSKELARVLESFSCTESVAYRLNLIDYVLRTEVDGYKSYSGDDPMDTAAWAYYIKGGLSGEDVRKMKVPSEYLADCFKQNDESEVR